MRGLWIVIASVGAANASGGATTATVGPPMDQLAEWKGFPVHTDDDPLDLAHKKEKHLPVLTQSGDKARIFLPHAQSEAHHVQAMWVEEEATGAVVCFVSAMAKHPSSDNGKMMSSEAHVMAQCTLPADRRYGTLVPFLQCNLDGLWRGKPHEDARAELPLAGAEL